MVIRRKKQPSEKPSPEPDFMKKRSKPWSSEPLDLQFLKEYKYSRVKDPNYKELAEFDDILTETFIDRVCTLLCTFNTKTYKEIYNTISSWAYFKI